MGVIDLLEKIEIHHNDRIGDGLILRPGMFTIERAHEGPPVGRSSQGIGLSFPAQALLQANNARGRSETRLELIGVNGFAQEVISPGIERWQALCREVVGG